MLNELLQSDVIPLSFQLKMIFRIVLSVILGMAVGIEREKRQKVAGLRTHTIVCVSSALMMLVSKYGFYDVVIHSSISVDASRIAASVVTAIGFLGAGVIYTRKHDNSIAGITTASGLWATVGIGIAVGSGLHILAIFTTLVMIFMQTVLHKLEISRIAPYYCFVRTDLSKHNIDIEKIRERLVKYNGTIKDMKVSGDGGSSVLNAKIIFQKKGNFVITKLLEDLENEGIFDTISSYAIF